MQYVRILFRYYLLPILLLVQILAAESCTRTKFSDIEQNKNLDKETVYYDIITGEAGLDSLIMNQIDPDLDYFCNGDFIYFGIINVEDGPNPFSRMSDIHIDRKLWNYFLIVFTKRDSVGIIGYIKQIKYCAADKLEVNYCELKNILKWDKYDIYVFHNDILLIKDRYTCLSFRECK
jgi:hypothetical protein